MPMFMMPLAHRAARKWPDRRTDEFETVMAVPRFADSVIHDHFGMRLAPRTACCRVC